VRAIAFTLIAFVYLFGLSMYLVDEVAFKHTTIEPRDINGNPIVPRSLVTDVDGKGYFDYVGDEVLNPQQGGTVFDRISQFALTTYSVTWTMLELLSGNYMWNTLGVIGVDPALVFVIKLIWPLFVGFQVMWFLVGRY